MVAQKSPEGPRSRELKWGAISKAPHDLTQLLQAWARGDNAAQQALVPFVYDELRHLAAHYMKRERPGHTLQPTALVNEVYLRMVGGQDVHWQNRSHFFAVAATQMRRILVDWARARRSQKRGNGAPLLPLDEALEVAETQTCDLVALDDALSALAAFDERKSRVVEMRFFAGLGVEETAEALAVSPETVKRDWRIARLWLRRELDHEKDHDP